MKYYTHKWNALIPYMAEDTWYRSRPHVKERKTARENKSRRTLVVPTDHRVTLWRTPDDQLGRDAACNYGV